MAGRPGGRRPLAAVQRAVLGALMSLAVTVAERRIRKALRHGGGSPQPGGETTARSDKRV